MHETWRRRVERSRELAAADNASRSLLAFYGTLLRAQTDLHDALRSRRDNHCPFCGGAPQLSVLRGGGDPALQGGSRALQCATCLTTWPFRRILCAQCGEEDERKLEYFESPAFDHIRVEACDTCKHY